MLGAVLGMALLKTALLSACQCLESQRRAGLAFQANQNVVGTGLSPESPCRIARVQTQASWRLQVLSGDGVRDEASWEGV